MALRRRLSCDQCDATLHGKPVMSERNVAASVRARLLNRASENKQDSNLVLTRYAIERLLYRVSISTALVKRFFSEVVLYGGETLIWPYSYGWRLL